MGASVIKNLMLGTYMTIRTANCLALALCGELSFPVFAPRVWGSIRRAKDDWLSNICKKGKENMRKAEGN